MRETCNEPENSLPSHINHMYSNCNYFVLFYFILLQGLECLVISLKCLVEWNRKLYTDPATTGLNSVSLSGTREYRYENEFQKKRGRT